MSKIWKPVFLTHVTLSNSDLNRLGPCLVNWQELSAKFVDRKNGSVISFQDLEKLLIMEINGLNRYHIVDRLRARYSTRQAKAVISDLARMQALLKDARKGQ